MIEIEKIKELARDVLAVRQTGGVVDNSLWDRSQRLLRNVDIICRFPEIIENRLQIDRFCLQVAACFAYSGLARHPGSRKPSSISMILHPNEDQLLELCTETVEKKLKGVLNESKIDKINQIISENYAHFTRMTEAMVLSDARNLDDMGAIGVFNEFRRYVIGGKSASDAITAWRRKIDYKYWQARLQESFRFEAVRKIAEQRLRSAEFFMGQLEVENSADDLDSICADSSVV